MGWVNPSRAPRLLDYFFFWKKNIFGTFEFGSEGTGVSRTNSKFIWGTENCNILFSTSKNIPFSFKCSVWNYVYKLIIHMHF